jgi:hypothetical protein
MKEALLSQGTFQDASDWRTKDGRVDMSLAVPGRLVTIEQVAGGGAARSQPLATPDPAGGRSFRPRAADRDDLAPGISAAVDAHLAHQSAPSLLPGV